MLWHSKDLGFHPPAILRFLSRAGPGVPRHPSCSKNWGRLWAQLGKSGAPCVDYYLEGLRERLYCSA